MSAVPNQTSPNPFNRDLGWRWIISAGPDLILILLTPVIAIPILLMLYSSWVGIKAETISIIVAAFFATGHHLPGMIRAYGDRDLFQRFRWRFLLIPPLLFLSYFPLYTYHYDWYRLIILVWATWHGLMQVYGFVRIYDAKVGSFSSSTVWWDWLVCFFGFVTPRLMRPDQVSSALKHWYSIGGMHIPTWVVNTILWGCMGLTAFVFVGYFVNYAIQWYRGPKPNPLKIIMLFSGIGMWWFAMTCVDNLLISIAIFDVCHDVQYLAIVWLFNCRRVNIDPHLGTFMRYVFRRGMVLLYLGLITAYGALGLVAPYVADGTVSQLFYAIMFTSTIFHYYLDGFIWKVREKANIVSLGLASEGGVSRGLQWTQIRVPHLIKWSPAFVVFGILFSGDLLNPSLTTARKNELDLLFAQSLVGNPTLPSNEEEQSWIGSQYEQAQLVADSVPQDPGAQLRAAILQANFGHNDEAIVRLDDSLKKFPEDTDILVTLGGIHFYRGNSSAALNYYQTALEKAKTSRQKAIANLKLGEFSWYERQDEEAERRFAEVLKYDPSFSSSIEFLRGRGRN